MDFKAIEIVKDYIKSNFGKSNVVVYVVWKCKVLQNWKYLISSSLKDGMYYELTYDGDASKWYFDVYKKHENIVIEDQ